MRRIPIDEQTYALEKRTTFCKYEDTPWKTVWKGEIKPFDKCYTVSITLDHDHLLKFKHFHLVKSVVNPRVIVEHPKIIVNKEIALSHHFHLDEQAPERSPLCLNHPTSGARWSENKFLADTIVPWTIQHLAAFEIKDDTGSWILPELHPGEPEEAKASPVSDHTTRYSSVEISTLTSNLLRSTSTLSFFILDYLNDT